MIKNWKRKVRSGNYINKKTGSVIFISKDIGSYIGNEIRWEVSYLDSTRKTKTLTKGLGIFKSKRKAQMFAINYMRRHPNG